MASKYIDRIVTNSANVTGDLEVGGTLYTSNVNGDSNFGIQMNIITYDGDVSNVSNLYIENVYGNVEIDEYSGNLADFSGNIGTIQNVSNITGNINNGVGGDVIINGSFTGNINGDILGNLEGDYNIYGNVGSISNITVNGDMSVSGNVENYHLHGNVEHIEIEGNILGNLTTGDITNYIIAGNVTEVSNITTLGNFTIEGDVGEYIVEGSADTLNINSNIGGNVSANTVTNIIVNGNITQLDIANMTGDFHDLANASFYGGVYGNVNVVGNVTAIDMLNGNVNAENYNIEVFNGNLITEEYTVNGNTGDINNATVSGNINIYGNVGAIDNFSGNLSTFGNVSVENYTVNGDVGAISADGNVNVTGNITGNIIGGTTNVNIDSNVLDLGANIRLNTNLLPVDGSGLVVGNIDGDVASLNVGPDGGWLFNSSNNSVGLSTEVSVDNGLHIVLSSIGVLTVDIATLEDRSSHIYTCSGHNDIVEFIGNNFLVSIKTVVETDIGVSFLTGVITSTGLILTQESSSPGIEYIVDTTGDLLISLDPGTEVTDRQTSTITLTLL